MALQEASDGVLFAALGGTGAQLFGDQESVCGNAQAGVVMESSPVPSLVMSQPELLLEPLVIALDSPAQVCHADQLVERRLRRQRREPVLGRFGLTRGPLNEQPPLRPQSSPPEIAPRMTHAQRRKAPGQGLIGSFAPTDVLQRAHGQRLGSSDSTSGGHTLTEDLIPTM